MAVTAVLLDVGGVLEVEPPMSWVRRWGLVPGSGPGSFFELATRIDPHDRITVGDMSEAELRNEFATALGLDEARSRQFMADLWDWYCGSLDKQLFNWAVGLRARVRVGLLSNSMAGARREEAARFGFPDLFDPIIYSHEVGLAKPDPAIYELAVHCLNCPAEQVLLLDDKPGNVTGAIAAGMQAVHHRDAATSIAAVTAALA